MTKEWQEATEEYLKVRLNLAIAALSHVLGIRLTSLQAQGSEPITGYKGMMVQSKPGGPDAASEDDE